LRRVVSESCVRIGQAKGRARKTGRILCLDPVLHALRRAKKSKKMEIFFCAAGRHGFVYPIIQGDTIYGYVGACYTKRDVGPRFLGVVASFTDTVVREVQKELELAKLYETIRPRAIALSTVHTVHRLLTSTLDLSELLPRIARLSLQIVRANRCSIKLLDSKREVLLPKTTVDLREKKTRLKKVRLGRWAPGKAAKFSRPVRGRDYLAVPLIDEDVIGVITVYDKIDELPFTSSDQEIMATLAEQAVIAIKNAQLYKEQEKLTLGGIKSLAMILRARAHGTYGPRASFLKLISLVGQAMHVDAQGLRSLEYAALLHDAGQIIVPDEVLTKPEKLTGEEYELVKEHPLRSVNIIKPIKALKSVIPIILHHHENYDGTGYPKKLRDGQIPLGARIMAVVGAFEAMTTKRSYRPIRTPDEAIEEIKAQSGKQFDPRVVEVFLRVIKRRDVRAMAEKEYNESK
jgi:HD-GYP domain-containing protein (c-di-GMP phosphodiesterase class II)